ncbi:Diacetyl reductase [Sphaceloma murrayae]|uniref:Diacetyl reductase n=1 Tax=Sphaceloma murrayae TaxID=2082308 RepID=A0A2K1QP67_9PEZI|nr:Diacetyl reductase [Sphaceloma murrayae]
MVQPKLHTEPYPAIAPQALEGANRGKIAVVTGAARGIGQGIAESLARSGADVALLDIDVERQSETLAICEKYGIKTKAYGCDVTKDDVVQSTFKQIVGDFGPVDILVNNAGRNSRRPMAMETFDQIWAGVELNLKAALLCMHQVLPSMRERSSGCVINIASRAGTVTTPFAGAYSMGKAALIRATNCYQVESEVDGFGDKIQFYALHPGAVKTQMTLPVDPDVEEKYPAVAQKWRQFHGLFRVTPSVCGQTCAFLAAGKGKALRGKYFDCEQDIATVLEGGPDSLRGLYELKVDFLDGLPNDGGTAFAVVETKK